MAEQLRAQAAPLAQMGSVLGTHIVAQNCLQLQFQEIWVLFSGLYVDTRHPGGEQAKHSYTLNNF